MGTASQYWDQIYTDHPFAKGQNPDPFLERYAHRLQKGKVLDIGMGEGQNYVYLAKKGFQVKGFDISQVAVQHAKDFAQKESVNLEVDSADLDLFILGLLQYDTIIMIDFKPPVKRYYSEIIRALKQGGTLLVKSYMDAEMPEALGPEDAYKNFYFHSNELIQNLRDLRILFYNEDRVDGKKVVQCLAQKPTDKDAAKFNLFDMQSKADTGPSRQHELAEALFKKK